jgi:hypothetical protein
MSFDAGAVTGSLGLNISEYAHGMIEAETIMRAFPPIVAEFMESPLLAAAAIAREAANAIGEMVSEVMGSARAIDLASQKAGMGVEEFSRLAKAAEFVGIGVQQLGTGLRMMQVHASDAVLSGGEAAAAFNSMGISTQFLKQHLSDTGALFAAVLEHIDRLGPGSDRAAAAVHALGRSGAELIPFLSMGSEKIRELADEAARWGAVETEESASAAAAWKMATLEIGFAWEGIKKLFAEAIAPKLMAEMNEFLTWVQANMPEIKQHVERIAQSVVTAVELVTPLIRFLLEHLDGLVLVLGTGALLKVVASAMTAVNLLGGEFVTLAAKIELVTAAQVAFSLAKQGAIGGAVGALTTGGIGGAIGGTVGGVVGSMIGTAIAPGLGTYAGGAIGGYIGGAIGGKIEQHFHVQAEFDPKETAGQFADKVQPQIRDQYNYQQRQLNAAASTGQVARALGGREPHHLKAGL